MQQNRSKFNVIIPAAGKATRMRPLSNNSSKSMIPINGKPIISYIIDQIKTIGDVQQIIVVHNELGDIKRFLDCAYNDINIDYCSQLNPQGPLEAIQIGANKILEHNYNIPTLIWLGDTICLENDIDVNADFVVTSVVEDYERWCLIDEDNNLYDKPKEKPCTTQALIGLYNFKNTNECIHAINSGMNLGKHCGEFQISSMLKSHTGFKIKTTNEWYDCGELNTFYESKSRLLHKSARAFNSIKIDTFYNTVTKSASTPDKILKIAQERNWFLSINETQSLFCPRILSSDDNELKMTLVPGVPLNEMWLYEDVRIDAWELIFEKILKIHNSIFYNPIFDSRLEDAIHDMYFKKNISRMNSIKIDNTEFPEFEYMYNFVNDTGLLLCNSKSMCTNVMHGDSHMGNILFDAATGGISFVDPRGHFGGIVGTTGDLRYDMGKIMQDFYMNYADILSGNYKIEENIVVLTNSNEEKSEKLVNYLSKLMDSYGYDSNIIKRLSIMLLITCIPFHYDDKKRQLAFWLHALNKIKKLDNE